MRCRGRTARRSPAKRVQPGSTPGGIFVPCVHDVMWQRATSPGWTCGFKSHWTLSSRAPRCELTNSEQVLCDVGATCAAGVIRSCPVAQWLCGRLLSGWLQVRVLPGQLCHSDKKGQRKTAKEQGHGIQGVASLPVLLVLLPAASELHHLHRIPHRLLLHSSLSPSRNRCRLLVGRERRRHAHYYRATSRWESSVTGTSHAPQRR